MGFVAAVVAASGALRQRTNVSLAGSIGALVEASMRSREPPGTVAVRYAEHILKPVRIHFDDQLPDGFMSPGWSHEFPPPTGDGSLPLKGTI
jgi:hypothetical protein